MFSLTRYPFKMKRISVVILILFALLLFCSCGGQAPEDPDDPASGDIPVMSEEITGSAEQEADPPADNNSDAQVAPPPAETKPEVKPEPEAKPETHPEPEVLHDPVTFMYHLIMAEPYTEYTSLFVHPDDFSRQLDLLNNKGYQYLFAEDHHPTASPSAILTFDDGYADNYTTMFPILKEKGAKATIFMVTDFIDRPGYLTKEQIVEMSQSGYVSFQSHTKTHADLDTLSKEQLHQSFSTANAVIEELTGRPVTAISYPRGICNPEVSEVVRQYYSLGYTILPPNPKSSFNAYRMPRYNVTRGLEEDAFLDMLN